LGLISWFGIKSSNGQNIGEFSPPAMKIDPIQMSGIIRYDIDEVCKKIKLNPDSNSFSFLKESFIIYHDKLDSLELSNRTMFDSLKNSLTQGSPLVNGGMDFGKFRNQLDSVKLAIEPIKERSKEIELDLNKNLVTFLSEKQYHKWLIYQEKSKKEQLPPMPMPMSGPPMEFLR
jgi:hypothetical protein